MVPGSLVGAWESSLLHKLGQSGMMGWKGGSSHQKSYACSMWDAEPSPIRLHGYMTTPITIQSVSHAAKRDLSAAQYPPAPAKPAFERPDPASSFLCPLSYL